MSLIEERHVYFKPDPRFAMFERENEKDPDLITIFSKENDNIVGCIEKVHVHEDLYARHFCVLQHDSYHGKISKLEHAYRGNWLTDILYEIEQNYVISITGELVKCG